MRGSIYFHNLKNEELKLYLTLITNDSVSFDKTTLNERHTLAEINILQNLIDKGFLKESETQITLPNPYDLVNHFLQQEYDYRSSDIELEGEPGYLGEIKKYLLTVQKQLTHVETESRKAFLNLRKMVDKISEQGKNNLNYAFERALDRNTESGT